MNKTLFCSYKIFLILLAMQGFSSTATAAEQTYVREYTYQASEADSKLSARTIALQEIKRELLNELGTHVTALVKIQNSSDGTTLGREEIETLSAGVTRIEILDEKWNGVIYVLKAQIKADPEDVLKSLYKMLDASKKEKQITQLGGELTVAHSEKQQFAESLIQSRKEISAALAEITRLKKQLGEKQTDAAQQTLRTAYQQQVDYLTSNELFVSALQYYDKGHFSEAMRLFRKVAEQGSATAQHFLGIMYLSGEGVLPNYFEAAKWFRLAAEQGYASAQYILGQMYSKILEMPRDYTEAVKWYRLAAEQGQVDAQIYLGLIYFNGQGVRQDYQESMRWFRKAAELGNAMAQAMLGGMYSEGKGIQQDYSEAVKWHRLAADQGNVDAQVNLGVSYARGQGVPQNYQEAVKWYFMAAEQGNGLAQVNLGSLYYKGQGVLQNYREAVKWYRLAAVQDLTLAQVSLGLMYVRGEGVVQDDVRARMWINIAAAKGDSHAQRVRVAMAQWMTPAQIAKAQMLASDCEKNNYKECR